MSESIMSIRTRTTHNSATSSPSAPRVAVEGAGDEAAASNKRFFLHISLPIFSIPSRFSFYEVSCNQFPQLRRSQGAFFFIADLILIPPPARRSGIMESFPHLYTMRRLSLLTISLLIFLVIPPIFVSFLLVIPRELGRANSS
jgi:hypothetical protein